MIHWSNLRASRLLSLLFVGLLTCSCDLPWSSYRSKFDSATWRAESSVEGSAPTTRQKMLGHLMKSVLPGKSRTEVEKLLGPPSQSTFGKVFEADSFYYLGNERGLFSIDSEWLLIWYDDRGEFERAELVAD